ncbi:MAG: histidine phosphatase family protein [Gammaproteobacteria bacterium]|nr:histidine phosphatase family protein [Gammaproteobacteria bacterium]MDH5592187.1 histidine phosphatase family protein [Gammaproteobacteria bacterium]
MTFSLYLLRHAKSDMARLGTSDFDRPINASGEKSAKSIGQWMTDNNKIPQQILSSSALRAKQTTVLVLEGFNDTEPEKVSYQEDLYLADLETLLQCIQEYKKGINSLMLVAHNPGLEELVYYLSPKSDKFESMTTANLAIFEYPDSEFDVYSDKGELVEFIRPS